MAAERFVRYHYQRPDTVASFSFSRCMAAARRQLRMASLPWFLRIFLSCMSSAHQLLLQALFTVIAVTDDTTPCLHCCCAAPTMHGIRIDGEIVPRSSQSQLDERKSRVNRGGKRRRSRRVCFSSVQCRCRLSFITWPDD